MKTEYIINQNNTIRYVLAKYETNPLIVFGINPSTATAEENDTTISIVEKIAKMRGCDGYIMLNVCPIRATEIGKAYPEKIDLNILEENLRYIKERIPEGAEVIAAWGSHILDRKYFTFALEKINEVMCEKKAKWLCLCKTKKGHPHHPTRLAYKNMTFEEFDVGGYIGISKK